MNREQIIRRTRNSIMDVLDGLSLLGVITAPALERGKGFASAFRGKEALAEAAKRKRPLILATKAPAKRKAGSKTARILAVLGDRKPHTAKELALAAGVTPGHVHQHLLSRVRGGEVKKPAPGVFRLNGKKAKAA